MVPPDMTKAEVRGALVTLAQAITSQSNREVRPRLRDFVRMNPPTFLGSKVGEDPQAFLDEVYKIVHDMGVTYTEKVELASYQLKDVAQVCFTQWKDNRPVESGPIEWKEFKKAFLDRYFLREKIRLKLRSL